jgi:mannosidase alpha-like ER degradation enhancer 1
MLSCILCVSSLSSFWPGVQVLAGDVESAVDTGLALYALWRHYGGLPESFNLDSRAPQAGSEG